jgi:hypothetical protein
MCSLTECSEDELTEPSIKVILHYLKAFDNSMDEWRLRRTANSLHDKFAS